MVFITDIFYYGHLSCLKTSLLRTSMETSLLRTPLYFKYPYLWYGHVFITDTSQSLLQTPINCRRRWYGDVFITDIAYYRQHPFFTDTSGMDMSLLRTPLICTFLLRTLLWTTLLCRQLYHSLISNRGGLGSSLCNFG